MTSEQYRKWPRGPFVAGKRAPRSLHDRLWEKIDTSAGPDACWTWMGTTTPNGYGQLRGPNGRARAAHRLVWEEIYGPADRNLDICHRCDNRPCCNPTHLFLGTRTDNMQDCARKGRNFAPRGEASPVAKLTDAQVAEIRHLYDAEGITRKQLSARFGVHVQTISMIVRRLARCA